MNENNEVNTVTIPLEEYIELRQAKQNNMYLCDRFAMIDDTFRTFNTILDDRFRDIQGLLDRVRSLEAEVKKLKDA